MFDRGLWGEKEKLWLAFAHLCGISTSTMNNFKLPTWCHWTRAWEEMCTVGSFEPARASSAHQCWCSFCFKLWSPGCASKGQNFQAVVESCVVSRGQEEWDKSESLSCFLPLNLINKAFYECSWTDWHPYDPVRESKSESKLFEGHSSILSVCTFWLLQPQGFYLVNPIFPIYKHTHTHTHTRKWKWKLFSRVHLFVTSYSPWNSSGQNTGVGSLSFLQGIFPTQRLNRGLLHCRQIFYQLSHKGSPYIFSFQGFYLINPTFPLVTRLTYSVKMCVM